MKYRPDIDGLRAVAVLPVVFYHAGLSGVPGGFVGVDVFFVISGYLITRIIHDEMLEGRFSILHFYERRARRILPALLTVMAASLAMGWVWLSPADYDALARSAGSVLVFLSNVWFWQNSGGYFDGATDYLPLLHTWSLAAEEQFYILFPLVLLVLVRMGRRATLWVTVALVLGSLVLAAWATPRMPSASFYLLPTRIWELGVGSLLALGMLPRTAPRWLRELGGLLGLAAIAYSVTQYDGATVFPGLAALPPVLGAAALLWVGGAGGSLAGRMLSWQPIVFVGLLSYSLYLWHWPIMAFARNRLTDVHLPPAWQAGTIALSVLLAWASWRYVERPFRTDGARRMRRGKIFAASGAGMAVLGTAAAAIVMTGGVEQRFDSEELAALNALGYSKDIRECRGARDTTTLCRYGAPEGTTRWLLWGDSHAEVILPALDVLAREQGVALDFASEPGCLPVPGLLRSDRERSINQDCLRFAEDIAHHASETGYDRVLLHGRWPLYVEGVRYGPERQELSVLARPGQNFARDASGNPAVFADALSDLLNRLVSAGPEVVVLGPIPEFPFHVGDAMRAKVLYGQAMPAPPTLDTVRVRQAKTLPLLGQAADHPRVTLVELVPGICSGTCPTHDRLTAFYRDNNHVTPEGARRLVLPVLRAEMPIVANSSPKTGD